MVQPFRLLLFARLGGNAGIFGRDRRESRHKMSRALGQFRRSKRCCALAFLVSASLMRAADIQSYSVSKQENFNQFSSGPPTINAASAYVFSGGFGPTSINSVSNANLQLPTGTSFSLSSGNKWHERQTFSTQSALDAAFGSGIYIITLYGTHDGYRSLPLTLPADSFPPAPHISNFADSQSINPAANFTLMWDAFSGAGPLDNISITVYDEMGDTEALATLPNSATSFQVPANTLAPGHTYYAILAFTEVVTNDASMYPGVTGSVFFSAQTYLNLGLATNTPPPRLNVLTPSGSDFQLQLIGQTNQQYVVEASATLLPGSWVPVTTNTASGGQFTFIDPQSPGFPVRFYRARQAN